MTGDIADEAHRGHLLVAVEDVGRLDLLVHNASTLGPTPMRALDQVDGRDLTPGCGGPTSRHPLALTRDLLPALTSSSGTLLSISSDAAVEHYPTWGLYGATKAALDHVTLTFGVENPGVAAYALDPGDMRTAMHQAAFPGEDISDRPLPERSCRGCSTCSRTGHRRGVTAPPTCQLRAERRGATGPGDDTLASARARRSAPGAAFAPAPAEQRGLARDGVRLLVARPGAISHAHFRDLPTTSARETWWW